PVQVEVIPVSPSAHMAYAADVADQLKQNGLRVHVDVRDEKIGYKIREAQTKKIPYSIVLGDNEMESGSVNIRKYSQKETETLPLDTFIQQILEEINNKSKKA